MQSSALVIRELQIKDIEDYEKWTHPDREYHKFNGPYFKKATPEEHQSHIRDLKTKLLEGNHSVLDGKMMLADKETDTILGQLNWYWKSKETYWLEVGIAIFNEAYWGKGIGFDAMSKWIDRVFEMHPEIVRIGLTTWSGNERMMKLAEKLGLKKEAVYRNARIVEGKYYDSVSYGILKDEWFTNQGHIQERREE